MIEVLHRVATAMERTAELLRTRLEVPALFVSPPGMLYWGGIVPTVRLYVDGNLQCSQC